MDFFLMDLYRFLGPTLLHGSIKTTVYYFSQEFNHLLWGFIAAFGVGFGVQLLFGVPEGPYYYDENEFMPEEYEYCNTPMGRFLYKYWFTSLRVRYKTFVFKNSMKKA